MKNVPQTAIFYSRCGIPQRGQKKMLFAGRNLRLGIEYDGTKYCGWQAQRSHRFKSIQEVIEKTLQRILREKIKLIASGRTDAGVHAQAQVANFKTHSKITTEKLQRALNGLLPQDIKINAIKEAPLGFTAVSLRNQRSIAI
jgi:tRNA pseudouridine38-40 synthase